MDTIESLKSEISALQRRIETLEMEREIAAATSVNTQGPGEISDTQCAPGVVKKPIHVPDADLPSAHRYNYTLQRNPETSEDREGAWQLYDVHDETEGGGTHAGERELCMFDTADRRLKWAPPDHTLLETSTSRRSLELSAASGNFQLQLYNFDAPVNTAPSEADGDFLIYRKTNTEGDGKPYLAYANLVKEYVLTQAPTLSGTGLIFYYKEVYVIDAGDTEHEWTISTVECPV